MMEGECCGVVSNGGSARLTLLNRETKQRQESAHFTWRKGTTLSDFTKLLHRHSQALVGSYKSSGTAVSSPEDPSRATFQYVSISDSALPVEIHDIFSGKVKAVHVVYDGEMSSTHLGRPIGDRISSSGRIRHNTCESRLSVHVGRSQQRYVELMSWNKQKKNSIGEREGGGETFIPWSEVAKHNKRTDCWVVLNDTVYDITNYLDFHPGGSQILAALGGKDITSSFYKYHPWVNAGLILQHNQLGKIEKRHLDPL